MRLALEGERRLPLVSGPDALLGVIELGAGARCSVLALAVADEDDGGDDEDHEHGDTDDDGDDSGGDRRTLFGLEDTRGVDDADGRGGEDGVV